MARYRKEVYVIKKYSNCPRCGKNHANMRFTNLRKPTHLGFTFWGMCPKLREPIMSCGRAIDDPRQLNRH